jgi:hypothetical protein
MHLHWDGNNKSVIERNISASLGAGATPKSLDEHRMLRVAQWCGAPNPLEDEKQSDRQDYARRRNPDYTQDAETPVPRTGELPIPKFPFAIDKKSAAKGQQIYQRQCAECHDWRGARVGEVEPIETIGTDPERWRSYTTELAVNQNTLGAGHWWRFSNFRKTEGYANQPLDGIWARAPYLHNGSVPTLRELLKKSDQRVDVFYRGDDEYVPQDVGFQYTKGVSPDGRMLFRYDTSLRGNDNAGHEYGTDLSDSEINDLLEYLKTL